MWIFLEDWKGHKQKFLELEKKWFYFVSWRVGFFKLYSNDERHQSVKKKMVDGMFGVFVTKVKIEVVECQKKRTILQLEFGANVGQCVENKASMVFKELSTLTV